MTNDVNDARDETRHERLDRELIELLNELRVALPGVQVLFAFLLTVPFSSRFESLDDLQRNTFLVTFLLTTVATALLMTPAAFHRLRFRQDDKEALLQLSNRFAIAGIAILAVAIASVVFMVGELMVSTGAALILAICVLLMFVGFWFVLPLSRKFDRSG